MLPSVQFEGTLVADPEIRFTPGGHAVTSVRIACNDRRKENGQWVDGETTFLSVQVWRTSATNLVDSAHKGDRIVGWGRLVEREWEDRDGNKRKSMEVQAQQIGMDLTFRSMSVNREAQQSGSPGVLQDSWGEPPQQPAEAPF